MATTTHNVAIDIKTSSSSNSQEIVNENDDVNSTSNQPDDEPCSYLFTREGRSDYIDNGVPLYIAAMKGDVKEAERIIRKFPQLVRHGITEGMETVLHIAAINKQVHLVKKLMSDWITDQDLRLKNRDGNTALSFVAISGNVSLAERMVDNNPDLPKVRNKEGVTPLHLAALLGHEDMVRYLYGLPNNDLTDRELRGIFILCIRTGLYDVASDMLQRKPELATSRGSYDDERALHVLAQKSLFCSGVNHDSLKQKIRDLVRSLWQEVLKLDHEEMWYHVEQPTILSLDAAESGNVEFLVELINLYPDLIWRVNKQKQSIFHYAIKYRHESIFSLIYEVGSIKDFMASYVDENENNMLHLAALLPRQHRLQIVSGAALQMQRELLWFKAVERVVQPSYREKRNKETKTPWELFREEHEGLMKEGEGWMKKTAESLLLIPTLIATVVFACIFTVPGGSKENSGEPHFLRKISFTVFVISDAMSLFFSLASILMFLSILASRYTEDDFIKRLPFKLMVGLGTLFISIGSMMVTFSTTLFIIYDQGEFWIPRVIAILVPVPMVLCAFLYLPLLIDVWNSTDGSKSMFQPKNKLFKTCVRGYPREEEITS